MICIKTNIPNDINDINDDVERVEKIEALNEEIDVYNDWGKLNGGVVRVKRTGAGMYDTSYQIAPTARNEDIPDERKTDVDDLPAIKEYYLGRYGGTPNPSSQEAVSVTSNSSNNLF